MTRNVKIIEQDTQQQEEEQVKPGREMTLEEAEREYQRLFGMAIRKAGLE